MLLARLKAQGSRALIFTQMSRMLDILEVFLNLHAFTYLRLDGSTKPEQRQVRTCADSACTLHRPSSEPHLDSFSILGAMHLRCNPFAQCLLR